MTTHRYSPCCVCARCVVQDAIYRGYVVGGVTVLAAITLVTIGWGLR